VKHILSLGAGVQSSTLALMAARGEVKDYPCLDAAIFADTQDEPLGVYAWLDWLEQEIARSPHPFPVYRVTGGRLSERALMMRVTKDGRRYSNTDIPFFTKAADGSQGKITHRACTYDYKIRPILKKARQLGGIKRGQKQVGVISWIGISLDEVHRMKMSRQPWAENCWPLVDMRMRRHDCLIWMERNGYPKPPRSSCVYCPYHSNAEWRRLKDEEPEAWQRAVQFERDLQRVKGGTDNMQAVPFLHKSLKPLDKVDLSTLEDHGQMGLWGNECEGMCGV
jgi:ribosomal protein L44E